MNEESITAAEEAASRDLDLLLRSYRAALPDRDAGPDFTRAMWRQIESRQSQTNFFGRMSKVLVTAALAASVLMGIMLSASNYQSISFFNGNYIEALTAHENADLDPYHPDRLIELEQQ